MIDNAVLFHFTKSDKLFSILNRNRLVPGFTRSICFTRDTNHFYIHKLFNFDSCIVVDREKLSNNYSFTKEYGWVYTYEKSLRNPMQGFLVFNWYKNVHKIDQHPNVLFNISKKHGRESEERINRPVDNISRYIKELILENNTQAEALVSYGKKHNISISSASFKYEKIWYKTRKRIYTKQ